MYIHIRYAHSICNRLRTKKKIYMYFQYDLCMHKANIQYYLQLLFLLIVHTIYTLKLLSKKLGISNKKFLTCRSCVKFDLLQHTT